MSDVNSPEIHGDWLPPDDIQGLHSRIELDAEGMSKYWKRNSLCSNFWSEYNSLVVPLDMEEGWLSREAVLDILSYLHNELFENCAKFSSGNQKKVIYQSWSQKDKFRFQFQNYVKADQISGFKEIIFEFLNADDLDELYFNKLEVSEELGDSGSGLGYLTLMKDFGIRFGFCFVKNANDSNIDIEVNVQAELSLKEV